MLINTCGAFVYLSRNLASTACRKGQVTVNGQIVKPSREVLPSDQLKVRKDQIWHHLEVIAIPKSRVGAKLVGLYCFEKIDAEKIIDIFLVDLKNYVNNRGIKSLI